jgi:hypothetical protein
MQCYALYRYRYTITLPIPPLVAHRYVKRFRAIRDRP